MLFDQSSMFIINTPEPTFLAQMMRIYQIIIVDNDLFPREKELSLNTIPRTELYVRDYATANEVATILRQNLVGIESQPSYWYCATDMTAKELSQAILSGEADINSVRVGVERLMK